MYKISVEYHYNYGDNFFEEKTLIKEEKDIDVFIEKYNCKSLEYYIINRLRADEFNYVKYIEIINKNITNKILRKLTNIHNIHDQFISEIRFTNCYLNFNKFSETYYRISIKDSNLYYKKIINYYNNFNYDKLFNGFIYVMKKHLIYLNKNMKKRIILKK